VAGVARGGEGDAGQTRIAAARGQRLAGLRLAGGGIALGLRPVSGGLARSGARRPLAPRRDVRRAGDVQRPAVGAEALRAAPRAHDQPALRHLAERRLAHPAARARGRRRDVAAAVLVRVLVGGQATRHPAPARVEVLEHGGELGAGRRAPRAGERVGDLAAQRVDRRRRAQPALRRLALQPDALDRAIGRGEARLRQPVGVLPGRLQCDGLERACLDRRRPDHDGRAVVGPRRTACLDRHPTACGGHDGEEEEQCAGAH
jgi:hypothetical protein